jgi:hypothetical protein
MQLMHKCSGFVATTYIILHTYSFVMYFHDQIMNSLLQHLHKFSNTNNKSAFRITLECFEWVMQE